MIHFRLGHIVPVVPGESREYVVARYLEIEIAISRQLSYLRLIQDKAFLNTMVIINITIYYYYSLRLNTRGAASAARGRIRLVWGGFPCGPLAGGGPAHLHGPAHLSASPPDSRKVSPTG